MVVLDEWSSYRGGPLNRFDCISISFLYIQNLEEILIQQQKHEKFQLKISSNKRTIFNKSDTHFIFGPPLQQLEGSYKIEPVHPCICFSICMGFPFELCYWFYLNIGMMLVTHMILHGRARFSIKVLLPKKLERIGQKYFFSFFWKILSLIFTEFVQ